MGVAAILVMWPRPPPHEQTFVPLTHEDSTWNLASFDTAVLEKMMFENVDRRRMTDACLHYKLTYETLDQAIHKPEDNWSCIAHLSAEDMLKSAVTEVNIAPWQGQTTH